MRLCAILFCLPTNHLHISELILKLYGFFYVFVGLSHSPLRREKVSISCKNSNETNIYFFSYLSVLNLNVTTGDYI